MKTNLQKPFLYRVSTKSLYLMTIALLTAVVAGLLLMPTFSSTTASAHTKTDEAQSAERATPEMLAYALNFKSAASYSVFANAGVTSRNSQIKGSVGVASRDAEINGLQRASVKGSAENTDGADTAQTKSELDNSLKAVNQLPCTELKSGSLGGATLKGGVYCLAAADLAGQLTLDGDGDATSVFVFRVAGSLDTADNSSVALVNGAQAGRVIFAAGDSIRIGKNNDINGNLLAKNSVSVDAGSTLNGRALALEGKVSTTESNLGGGTGSIEICKAVINTPVDISNRIFQFTISGVTGTINVPVGSCSGPIDVPVGLAIVTELNTFTLLNGGSGSGNFQLVGVDVIQQPIGPPAPSTLGIVNLAARTAAVNITEGNVEREIVLRFTNRFAITGFVEICKIALDQDVTGFFTYTIDGVLTTSQQNPGSQISQIFTVPVGQCSAPIAVTVADGSITNGTPRTAVVRVTEIGRPGFYLESVDTVPVNREVGQEVLGSGVNPNGTISGTNVGGGYVTVTILESTNSANETLINFRNRSNPGLVKVCKIAGPGITENSLYRFTVTGTGPTTAAIPPGGPIGAVTRVVDVRAGSAASGGNCNFVPGFGAGVGLAEFQTFVIGSTVQIVENGLSPNNTIANAPGELRTSRIRSTSGGSFSIFLPSPNQISVASVPARREVVEVEFTNFIFNATALKVCKIAGAGVTLNTPFTFDVTFVSPVGPGGSPLFPAFTSAVTVNAGPAAQGGNCTFVDGSGLLGGAFNIGSTITITERAAATPTTVTAITSQTSVLTADLANRRATITGASGLIAGINSVVFTNTSPVADPPAPAGVRFDFDGDRKADLAVFRSSNGTWYTDGSSTGFNARQFGQDGDKIAPADYDGDGKFDYAVYRPSNGTWYRTLSGSNTVVGTQFGASEDIPVAADYNGDGKSELAVFRPSTGTWYLRDMTTNTVTSTQFGQAGDKPVAADYDGDGKADIAVYRASTGMWYRTNSGNGQFEAKQFGTSEDVTTAADYDGDGKAEIAVFRPSSGTWYRLNSGGQLIATQYGQSGDVAVPADYDGDGKADIAVYRASTGMWYRINSTNDSPSAKQFGMTADKAVPANYTTY